MKNCILIFLLFQLSQIIHINANPLQGGDAVKPAQENEFPFIVSLAVTPATNASDHFCGGTLISKKHVLTAKHCLINIRTGTPILDNTEITVTIGSIDMTRGRKLNVTSWTLYEDWAWENNIIAENIYHDVAIVTLSEEIVDIKPVTISKLNHKQIRGNKAVTAGWGINDDNVSSKFLQKATLHVISRQKCRFNFVHTDAPPYMVINHLCTVHTPPVVLGCGDSGGPLLLNGTDLIGVNESVCANDIKHPNEQNVHQSVEYYREFIETFAENTF